MMKCPQCAQGIHKGALECPHCEFSLEDSERVFGSLASRGRVLADDAGIFRHHERDTIERRIDRICGSFRELEVVFHTCSLPSAGLLRTYAFHVLNRCSAAAENPEKPRVILVLDPDNRLAALSYSYHFDDILNDDVVFTCLSRGHAYWLQGRYAEGTLRCLSKLEGILKSQCQRSLRSSKAIMEVKP